MKTIKQAKEMLAVLELTVKSRIDIIDMYTELLKCTSEKIGVLTFQIRMAEAEGLKKFDEQTYKK